jgi:hypothetical protein
VKLFNNQVIGTPDILVIPPRKLHKEVPQHNFKANKLLLTKFIRDLRKANLNNA